MKVLSLMSLRVYHTLSKRESECIPRNIFKARKAKWGSMCVKSLKTRVGGSVFVQMGGGLNYQYWSCQVLD